MLGGDLAGARKWDEEVDIIMGLAPFIDLQTRKCNRKDKSEMECNELEHELKLPSDRWRSSNVFCLKRQLALSQTYISLLCQ